MWLGPHPEAQAPGAPNPGTRGHTNLQLTSTNIMLQWLIHGHLIAEHGLHSRPHGLERLPGLLGLQHTA